MVEHLALMPTRNQGLDPVFELLGKDTEFVLYNNHQGYNDSGDSRQHLVSRRNDNRMRALQGYGLMG